MAEPKTKTPEQALNSLMYLASKSEKSSGDAIRLMRRWGVDADAIPKILKRLIDDRFIDDRRYAEAYVREKTNLSGWGAYKIRRMLVSKGISNNIINAALQGMDSDNQKRRLRTILERKLKSIKAANDYEARGKLLRYAASLGYGYEDASEVIDNMNF
jgi:regulatory protein